MSDMPTSKETRTSGRPELPSEPAQSLPPPVRLNPKPEKKKKLKVQKGEPLKKSTGKLFTISEDAPLLVDMDDLSETTPQPIQTKKPKRNTTTEDKMPTDILPPRSVRVHKNEPSSFAAARTPKPQEVTAVPAKEVEGDTSAPALKQDKSKKLKHEPPASIYQPPPPGKSENKGNRGADTSGKTLAGDTEDSGSVASKTPLIAPIVLSAGARKPENIPKVTRSLPASEELTGKSEDISNLGPATSGKTLSVDTEDSRRKPSKAPLMAPIVLKAAAPKKQKITEPKRSLPTSEGLPGSAEDKPAPEYQPHSVRVRKSETSSFTPATIPEQEDANSMNVTAATAVTAAAAATGIILSVEYDTPAPAPEPKLKLAAAVGADGAAGPVDAATGITLSAEDDSPAPAPKLKRKLPASTKDPENEDDEPATEFNELWSSAVPVVAALPPASSSKVYGSKEPADLEAGVTVEDGSETLWYKRKSLWAIVISLLVLIVLVTTIVVVTNNRNAEGGSGGEPTSSPVPTVFSPTMSPVPTVFSPTMSPTSPVSSFTVVIQLDENPRETGWKLACNGETLESVESGTYAFLAVRPNFRLEYTTITKTESECELTITDTGGDGLNGGYYEVYYGDHVNVGDPSALLDGGTVSGSITTSNFLVTPPTSLKPTASPTSFIGDQPNCTICPDGSTPGFPDAIPEGWGGFTCSQLDTILSFATLELSETDCNLVQDAAAYSCGCTNHCTTICPDGTSEPDPANADNIVFDNGEEVTCDDFQSQVASANSNSKDQCLFANYLGEEICGCPTTSGFCSMCQDGTVPPSETLQRDIVPGFSCLDLSGFAYALRDTDVSGIYFELCPAFEAVGAYCGCEVSADDSVQFCRLCGGNEDLLPEPARLVNSTILGAVTTCIHVEFASNANATSTPACGEFRNDTADECCF
jgi:hypothetical protein